MSCGEPYATYDLVSESREWTILDAAKAVNTLEARIVELESTAKIQKSQLEYMQGKIDSLCEQVRALNAKNAKYGAKTQLKLCTDPVISDTSGEDKLF